MRMVERLQSHEKAASERIIRTFIPSFLPGMIACLVPATDL